MARGLRSLVFSPLRSSGVGRGNGEFVQEWPVVENFEGDTVSDNEATLDAKSTHYDVGASGVTCQLVGYSTMPEIRDDRLVNCVTNPGSTAALCDTLVAAGTGFVPSDGNVVVCEGIFFSGGIGTQTEFYIRDASGDEGIHAYLQGSGNAYLRTSHLGSWTNKIGPIALTTSPHAGWHCFIVQYNFGTDEVYFRCIELGLVGADQQDSGWVSGGTVSGPTFDNSELVSFMPISRSDTAAQCGVAQCYVADAVRDGYALGTAQTHNYQAP